MWEWVSHGNWIYSISTWWEFYHQDTFLMLNFLKTSGRFSLYTHSPRDSTSSIRTFNRRKHDFFHYKSGIVDKSYQYCISGIQPALFVFCLAYNKPCENKVEMLYILTYVHLFLYTISIIQRMNMHFMFFPAQGILSLKRKVPFLIRVLYTEEAM